MLFPLHRIYDDSKFNFLMYRASRDGCTIPKPLMIFEIHDFKFEGLLY